MERPPRPPGGGHSVPRGTLAEILARGLEELGHGDRPELARDLARLAEQVAEWAPSVNLTAYRAPEAVASHLVLDALALAGALPPAASILDLGSGAGFPGFPLALLDRERPVTLVEARERAHHFQRGVVRALGLGHVRVLRGRAEELEPEPHAGVVAQAMGPPGEVAPLLARWAAADAWLAIPYSERSLDLPAPEGFRALAPGRYRVPLGGPWRSVWLARRG